MSFTHCICLHPGETTVQISGDVGNISMRMKCSTSTPRICHLDTETASLSKPGAEGQTGVCEHDIHASHMCGFQGLNSCPCHSSDTDFVTHRLTASLTFNLNSAAMVCPPPPSSTSLVSFLPVGCSSVPTASRSPSQGCSLTPDGLRSSAQDTGSLCSLALSYGMFWWAF